MVEDMTSVGEDDKGFATQSNNLIGIDLGAE